MWPVPLQSCQLPNTEIRDCGPVGGGVNCQWVMMSVGSSEMSVHCLGVCCVRGGVRRDLQGFGFNSVPEI